MERGAGTFTSTVMATKGNTSRDLHLIRPRKLIGVLFLLLLVFLGCDSENASDCFQQTGNISRVEVSVPNFDKITVFEHITLVVQQGNTQKVEIETGENLRNEVGAKVEEGRLLLMDTNDCNFVREYGTTVVYVTSPNITEIRSSTGFPIQSNGVLSYPSLTLLSESFNEPNAATTDGSFELALDAVTLNIVVNGIAYFQLRGTVENLNVSIAAGDSRIEAQELTAQNVIFNHRGSNDILVDPQLRLSGILRGTGDLQSFHRPNAIEVQELFTGRLIFRE